MEDEMITLMGADEVRKYAELMKEYELTELTVEKGRLVLKKEGKLMLPPMPPVYPAPFRGEEKLSPGAPKEEIKESAEDTNALPVKAPLLGLLHLSESANAKPFVKVGDSVKKGDTLCVIEAMKMMNDISAPRDGIIEKVCAEDSDIVEYGQTLFLMS